MSLYTERIKAEQLAEQTRQLQEEKYYRLQLQIWRENPMRWLQERFGENPMDYQWSLREGYAGHTWDGDKDPLYNFWMALAGNRWAAIEAATGCHAKGTQVIMYDGSVKAVEDIVVGDRLMGDDNTPRTVRELLRGRETMYRVIPNKGEPFVCNESHILSLTKTPTPGKYKSMKQVENVSIRDYLQWSKHYKHLYKLYRTGIDLPYRAVPYEPYFVGVWLGDGTRATTAVTNVDPEIVDYLEGHAQRIGGELHKWQSKDRTPTYATVLNGGGGGRGDEYKNPLKLYLTTQCVVNGEKRVPSVYLQNSREIRLEILAGLLDTDACVDGSEFTISTVYAGLAEDILYLARSLGFGATSRHYDNDHWGYHSIHIFGDIQEIPVKVARRKPPPRLQKKRVDVTGFRLEQLPEDDFYGFELDGNRLYMLKDFTVTHNTSKTYMLSRLVFWFLDCFKDSLVVTSAPKQAQLELHLWAEISKAFNKFKRIRPKAALYTLRLVVEEDERTDQRNMNTDDVLYAKSWQAVGFIAGVGSEEQSATKAQGFHRKDMLIITEETPGMAEPVLTAFKNTCTGGHNLIAAVGNPDNRLDPLHRFCVLPSVANFRVSAYDYPNVVLKEELLPGAVTIASIARRKEDYGVESELYKSRVRGISPAQSTESLIHIDWIEQCMRIPDKEPEYDNSWPAVGVDVANSIDGDKACCSWGRSNVLMKVQEFQCPNATHLAYNLFMSNAELDWNSYKNYDTDKLEDYEVMPQMIGVDAVGIGVATIQTLVDNGYDPQSLQGAQWPEAIPLEEVEKAGKITLQPRWKFRNLRSQMWWELREDMRLKNVVLDLLHLSRDEMDAIIEELATVKFKRADNFIAVESKDDIKKRLGGKSPNKGDSIVYWNWTRKGYRLFGGEMPINGG